MKKYIITALILLIVVLASGCIVQNTQGSGKIINQSRDVSDFNQVSVDGASTLIITQGDKESLTVEADDNLMPYIKTNVSNNTLKIYNNPILPTKTIRYYLTVKDINSINYLGSGNIQSNNLKVNSLKIRIDGAGNANLTNLSADTLKILIIGAGNLISSGNVNDQDIHISGAGKYSGDNLTSKTAVITIDGSGNAVVRVSNTLNATINGVGQISYVGTPKITPLINGDGTINKISS
ncbi:MULTISPECIES: head GIN domain-containing protein [Methanobacterium]|uniref:Putative auto-transporter adhesin head GIN domain-containing protein n=1 Tax=Methanobacterium bryantii TaxID=2161 RepID=A0A2A2HA81_METBR|nr:MULTISPECIES: head GIN domain-containing protein [Methanobacterium]OEC85259.1 hypothetical protein A9507_13880 [Methanobacterium sp. A39]PAV06226.1 hypothetical protein ASJ80_15460 [Methanobacterium bryantii]